MNYLAHIYLSRNQEMVSIGNFMADHIKGSKYKSYSEPLQIGILLHRQIDSFTDAHPVSRRSKRRLHDRYGLFRGIIIDIFYDHFLAKNWKEYSAMDLKQYSENFYELLVKHEEVLPQKVVMLSNYMIRDNWLLSYADIDGIAQVLNGMNRRTGSISEMDRAVEDLEEHYQEFENDFRLFFRDLCEFSDQKMNEIKRLYER